jgi:hypothetical protein
MVLGGWLFLSVFLWPHSRWQMTSTWIVGVALFVLGFRGRQGARSGRWMSALVALWLGLGTWLLAPRLMVTAINNLVIAAIVLLLSLVPVSMRASPTARPVGSQR